MGLGPRVDRREAMVFSPRVERVQLGFIDGVTRNGAAFVSREVVASTYTHQNRFVGGRVRRSSENQMGFRDVLLHCRRVVAVGGSL